MLAWYQVFLYQSGPDILVCEFFVIAENWYQLLYIIKMNINIGLDIIWLICIFWMSCMILKRMCVSLRPSNETNSKPKANILKGLLIHNSKPNLCMPCSLATTYNDISFYGAASLIVSIILYKMGYLKMQGLPPTPFVALAYDHQENWSII